jgi:hypothetical protein
VLSDMHQISSVNSIHKSRGIIKKNGTTGKCHKNT